MIHWFSVVEERTSLICSSFSRLVYRDIKQENIGFDTRGDVKVFDFGLCKGLSPSRKTKDVNGREVYGYNLTPRTGSVPYMAPEVAECKPYDCKADVFSFAILLWEMLSLRTAYRGYSRREFLERVVRGKERLSVSRIWPPLTRAMMKEAWDTDAQRRPDMKVGFNKNFFSFFTSLPISNIPCSIVF